MAKILSITAGCLIILLGFMGFCFCDDSGPDSEIGRYQIYSSCGAQSYMILLDTKTGKVWQMTADMAGKLKTEGVSVEGVAFASKENESMLRKLGEINLDEVSESDKKQCKSELVSAFSYDLDRTKVDSVTRKYLRKK